MDWLQLVSISIYDFGITEEVFWRLTPAKFFYLSRRHEAEQELRDFRMAYIISTIANVNRGKKGKAYKPEDFMPSKIAEKQRARGSIRPRDLKLQFLNALGHRVVKKNGNG